MNYFIRKPNYTKWAIQQILGRRKKCLYCTNHKDTTAWTVSLLTNQCWDFCLWNIWSIIHQVSCTIIKIFLQIRYMYYQKLCPALSYQIVRISYLISSCKWNKATEVCNGLNIQSIMQQSHNFIIYLHTDINSQPILTLYHLLVLYRGMLLADADPDVEAVVVQKLEHDLCLPSDTGSQSPTTSTYWTSL